MSQISILSNNCNPSIYTNSFIPQEDEGISESRLLKNSNIDKSIIEILKCKICFNILLNPYDCSKCGNTFCYNCINKLHSSDKKCPFGCQNYNIIPSSFALQNYLNKLQFECKNKNKGCNEILPYLCVEKHDKTCPYLESSCPNVQCNQKMKWTLLDNHIHNECPYTLFQCQNCHLLLNRKEIEFHENICKDILDQLNSQSILINKLSKEQIIKNTEEFNSFLNCLQSLNESFGNNDKNKENNYFVVLIKSIIFLLKYKFGSIERQLIDISNNLKEFNISNIMLHKKNDSDTFNNKYENKEKFNKANYIKLKKDNKTNYKITIIQKKKTKNNIIKTNKNTNKKEEGKDLKEDLKKIFEYFKTDLNNINGKNNELKKSYNTQLNNLNSNSTKSSLCKSYNNIFENLNKNSMRNSIVKTNILKNEELINNMKSTPYIKELRNIEIETNRIKRSNSKFKNRHKFCLSLKNDNYK